MRFSVLISAHILLLAVPGLAQIGGGGSCSNWMTMGLSFEVGVPDSARTEASCTALGNGGDFVTHYVRENNTCLICADEDWTAKAPTITTINAGTYEDLGGWEVVTLSAAGAGLEGTYTGTFVEGAEGKIKIWRDAAGTYHGEWSEPGIGRSGTLENFTIHADGSFSADWDTVNAGTERYSSGSSDFDAK